MPKKSKTQPRTREQMQSDVLVIDTLLETAQAMIGHECRVGDTLTILEMAHKRANLLHSALDIVNQRGA